jgi:hypothetical protein
MGAPLPSKNNRLPLQKSQRRKKFRFESRRSSDDPNSVRIAHSVGASGSIAGLMGAFLVRFPKMKIRIDVVL